MNFSIITCTYNPNKIIFERLIKAVADFEVGPDFDFEWIIVDNNSNIPISELFPALLTLDYVQLIIEKEPGLTSARRRGIEVAKYDWIVFFDDDNEPASDYLINVLNRIKQTPDLLCFGPGKIKVEFVGKLNGKWIINYREYFQEKDELFVTHSIPGWSQTYPQGTGQVVNKAILIDYIGKIKQGEFSVNDRTGKSLSSGGDVQIVLLAIKKGYKVGVDPNLKLNHLIDGGKATYKYIRRLVYGTSSAYLQAYNQVYNNRAISLHFSKNKDILKTVFYHFTFNKFRSFQRRKILKLCQKLGEHNAHYVCAPNLKRPLILSIVNYFLS